MTTRPDERLFVPPDERAIPTLVVAEERYPSWSWMFEVAFKATIAFGIVWGVPAALILAVWLLVGQ